MPQTTGQYSITPLFQSHCDWSGRPAAGWIEAGYLPSDVHGPESAKKLGLRINTPAVVQVRHLFLKANADRRAVSFTLAE